jgi:hypothetical protein
MIHIKEASSSLKLFYPKFVEVEGAVFVASELPIEGVSFSNFSDRTEAECLYNHIHILDQFHHSAALDGNDSNTGFYDQSHPDFKLGCEVAKVVAIMWRQKLEADFPAYRFRVYYTEAEDPTIRFHRVHAGEANWLDENDWLNDIAAGKVIVYDTGHVVHA